ncbi:MAG: hypothetical protein ACYTEG_12240 [Planctomycetota bacterium]
MHAVNGSAGSAVASATEPRLVQEDETLFGDPVLAGFELPLRQLF